MKLRKFLFILIPFLLTTACCKVVDISKSEYNPVVVNNLAAGNDAVSDSIIKPYSDKVSGIMNAVIGYADTTLWIGKPESTLGNYIADLLLEESDKSPAGKSDMALFNNGGLRVPISKGPITRGNIFKLMPFENEIVVVKLKGSFVKEMVDYIAQSGGQPVSGIKMGISNNKPSDVLIAGMPVDTAKYYRIVTSDYLARGGDKMNFFLKRSDMVQTGLKVRDAIIDFIQSKYLEGKNITGKTDGRVYNKTP